MLACMWLFGRVNEVKILQEHFSPLSAINGSSLNKPQISFKGQYVFCNEINQFLLPVCEAVVTARKNEPFTSFLGHL